MVSKVYTNAVKWLKRKKQIAFFADFFSTTSAWI